MSALLTAKMAEAIWHAGCGATLRRLGQLEADALRAIAEGRAVVVPAKVRPLGGESAIKCDHTRETKEE